jgi:hypothetical protein
MAPSNIPAYDENGNYRGFHCDGRFLFSSFQPDEADEVVTAAGRIFLEINHARVGILGEETAVLGGETANGVDLIKAQGFTWMQAEKFLSFVNKEVAEARSSGKAFDHKAAAFRVVQYAVSTPNEFGLEDIYASLNNRSPSPHEMTAVALAKLFSECMLTRVWNSKYSNGDLDLAIKYAWLQRGEADRLMSEKFCGERPIPFDAASASPLSSSTPSPTAGRASASRAIATSCTNSNSSA